MSLQTILTQMYEDSLSRDKIPQRRKLPNSLHLTLTNNGGQVTFEISRDKVYPSEKEWQTCLKYFPYFVGNITPDKCTSIDGRFALRARLPNRRQIAEQMKLESAPTGNDADGQSTPPHI